LKTAVISDVHSNKEALEAVLEDIEKQDVKRIVCLGDVVGYGPEPLEVISLIKKHTEFCIQGNHDRAVTSKDITASNPQAKALIEYTIRTLKPDYNIISLLLDKKKEIRKECSDYLSSMPERYSADGMLFVHASPGTKKYEYLSHPQDAFKALKENWNDNICFVGHTHLPFFSNMTKNKFIFSEENLEEVSTTGKTIVNVGSVGQPRDGDNRACYSVYHDGIVRFRRVKYDYQKTTNKMIKLGKKEGMSKIYEQLAHRLKMGR